MNACLKTLSLTLLACATAACSNISSKSPDEMVRHAVQHNLTRDNQYQFEGHIALETAPRTADTAPAAADKEARNTALIQHMLAQTQVHYSGAVDLPQHKIEIIPEIRYQTRQSLVSAKLPLQIDLRAMSVVVDPSAAAPFIDTFNDSKNRVAIGDKLVRIQLADFVKQDLPTEVLLNSLPEAIDAGLASLDKNAFRRMDMDEDGRQVGARYRVRLESTLGDSLSQSRAMLESLKTQLRRDGERDGASLPAGHATLISMMDFVQLLFGDFSDSTKNLNTSFYLQEAMQRTRIHTDYYLDGKGRMVALRQSTPFSAHMLLGNASPAQQKMWMTIRYTRPHFTLKPTQANTLSLKELVPSLADGNGKPPAALWPDLQADSVTVKTTP